MQVRYEIRVPRKNSLRFLCSLSRLEEAILSLSVRSSNMEDDVVWQASGGLLALRRLTIGCACMSAA
jgi:hypothetical protein